MNTIKACLVLVTSLFSFNALAALEPYKDYDIGQGVLSVTTVQVDANMTDVYLEGLRDTWLQANQIAKELGHIKDYQIFASELPQSGQFNLVLIVEFASGADMEPSKAKYDAFMTKWSDEQDKKTREIVKTYPKVREITGEYRLRQITLK